MIGVDGTTISWEPLKPIDTLWVWDAEGNLKWWVGADSSQLLPPIEYGEVPEGAYADPPATGTLETGDWIWMSGVTTTARGYTENINGDSEVPWIAA